MKLIRRRHSVTSLQVHLVFTTKYRRKVLADEHIECIKGAMLSACERLECELIEADGEIDHVHALVKYPPVISISTLVNNLKAVSSRKVRKSFPGLKRISRSGALWSRSYFACSVGGGTIDVVRRYIENQRSIPPHP